MIKELILNRTPVRTSNNYEINDIKLNLSFDKLREFRNISVKTDEKEKLDVLIDKKNIEHFETKIGVYFDKKYKIRIVVNENVKLNKPVYIEYKFESEETLIDELEFVFKENSEATFILKYSGNSSESIHHLKQINKVSKNSNAKIILANLIDKKSESFIAIENDLDDMAKLEYYYIDLGGKYKISNYYTNLHGSNAENIFKNIYFGKDNDIIDMNYFVEIYGQNAVCDIVVQGALVENSKKNFKGTIDFKEGAKCSIGQENENCLLLSNKAISKSLPMLLCHEENVQGAHGVSSGKIDEDKLFYIMSKGISKKEAEKLIVMANFNKILQNIDDEQLKNEIIEMIENNIS